MGVSMDKIIFGVIFSVIVVAPYSLVMMVVHRKNKEKIKSYGVGLALSLAALAALTIWAYIQKNWNNKEINHATEINPPSASVVYPNKNSMGVPLLSVIAKFNSISDDAAFAAKFSVPLNKIPGIEAFERKKEPGRTRLSYGLSPNIQIMFDVDENMIISSGVGVFGSSSKETARAVVVMAAAFYGKDAPEVDAVMRLCTNTQLQRATIGKFGVTCGFNTPQVLAFSIYPDDGEAQKVDVRPVKEHNYELMDGLKYGYSAELSEADIRAGKVARSVIMFAYAGQDSGKYQVHVIDGSTLTAAECTYPCEYVKIMTADANVKGVNVQTMKAAPNMIAYLALQDAINGKLQPYVITNKKGRFTVWLDEQKGITYTAEK